MTVSFRHQGPRKCFESGGLAGIQAAHANRLKMQLAALDIWVNGNWRITFEFENGNAHVLDYEDYH